MVISHRLKYCFVHTIKTAGLSIRDLLINDHQFQSDECGWWPSRTTEEYEAQTKVCSLYMHCEIQQIKQHILQQDKNPEEYFTFAFIRNPWDLVVSYYEFCLQNKNICMNGEYKYNIAKKSFQDFVTSGNIGIKNIYDTCISSGMQSVNFLGKYENIQKDCEHIVKTVLKNDNPTYKLNHLNKSIRRPYQEYHNTITKDWIYRNFKDVIDIGNYEF